MKVLMIIFMSAIALTSLFLAAVRNTFAGIDKVEVEKEQEMREHHERMESLKMTQLKCVGVYDGKVYTKKENLVKDLIADGYKYIARDKYSGNNVTGDNSLYAFESKPNKTEEEWVPGGNESAYMATKIRNVNFDDVTWEDEGPTELATYKF